MKGERGGLTPGCTDTNQLLMNVSADDNASLNTVNLLTSLVTVCHDDETSPTVVSGEYSYRGWNI